MLLTHSNMAGARLGVCEPAPTILWLSVAWGVRGNQVFFYTGHCHHQLLIRREPYPQWQLCLGESLKQ
jgi:hypothetical protein